MANYVKYPLSGQQFIAALRELIECHPATQLGQFICSPSSMLNLYVELNGSNVHYSLCMITDEHGPVQVFDPKTNRGLQRVFRMIHMQLANPEEYARLKQRAIEREQEQAQRLAMKVAKEAKKAAKKAARETLACQHACNQAANELMSRVMANLPALEQAKAADMAAAKKWAAIRAANQSKAARVARLRKERV